MRIQQTTFHTSVTVWNSLLSHSLGCFVSSSEVVSAMSIFDPRKAPKKDSHAECQCGEEAIRTLLAHYGDKKPAMTLGGEPTYRESVITYDIITEWKTYRKQA